jgi:phospholipid/cholesterol/gamma-HCH transport system substrate-binding protein
LPSQKQLRWSQLRVGITVIVAAVVLMLVIFLMSSTTGLFTNKIELYAYFDNAEGLRPGAPVQLQGVDIGNVTGISVVAGHGLKPVQVRMKVGTRYSLLRTDSIAVLKTAGVLGQTYVDVDSSQAKAGPAKSGDTLPTINQPDLQDVVRASQSSLENLNVLVKRLDRIIATVESGQGTVGKLIYDPSLYNRLNKTVNEAQDLVADISNGKGSIGKLVESDELYNKLNADVTKLDAIVNDINNGQGTVGKLIKDPSLYNNANETMTKAKNLLPSDPEFAKKLQATVENLHALTTKMNEGQGSVGKLFNDPSVYNNTDQLLTEARHLMQAIRENPKKYLTIHFKVF